MKRIFIVLILLGILIPVVSAHNDMPKASFTVDKSPEKITFTSTSYAPTQPGKIVYYLWKCNGRVFAESRIATITLPKGRYEISLTVKNYRGTSTKVKHIRIR